MKKILLSVLALGGLLFASSCQMQEPESGKLTGEVDFTITAGIPGGISTYAPAGTGSHNGGAVLLDADDYDLRYIMQVYDMDGKLAYSDTKYVNSDFTSQSVVFEARLIAKKYNFVFWADFVPEDSKQDNYYKTVDADGNLNLRKITYAIEPVFTDDAMDAYTKVVEVDLSAQNQNIKDIKLQRPFGKLRLIATDQLSGDLQNEELPASTELAYASGTTVPDMFDALTGLASGDTRAISKVSSASVQEDAVVNGTTYNTGAYFLIANYIFAADGNTGYAMDVTVKDKNKKVIGVRSLSQIPIVKNKLTTVIGNFYSNSSTLEVIVEDPFEQPEIYINQALLDAAENGGEVTLDADCIFTADMPALVVAPGKTLTVNLNGHTIESQVKNQDAIKVNGGTLIVNGNGYIKATGDGSNYAVWAIGGSKVILNGGNYYGNGACIQAKDNAQIEINGGYYKVAAPYNGVYFVINLQDNNPNTIVVTGGQFENCDPSNTGTEPENVNDNFLANGYSSVKISDNPDVYEVVKAHMVETGDDLLSAISDIAANGGAITIDESAEIEVSGLGTLSIEKPTTITVNGSINSSEENFMLLNNSTLVLKGEGSVNLQRRVVENHGTLIVEGGNYGTKNTTGGTAFWNNADGATMTLNDVNVDASFFAVAGKGKIEINGGSISSISSNKYGSWAYCIRAQEGGTMVIKNATIEGVQGCIASIESSHITLENVKVSARNSEPDRSDAFYAIYAASLGVIEVISGDFYSDRTPCALASDDDQEGAPLGGFILKGGRFSSYPKNDDGSIWQPESGFKYVETEDATYPYEIVSE